MCCRHQPSSHCSSCAMVTDLIWMQAFHPRTWQRKDAIERTAPGTQECRRGPGFHELILFGFLLLFTCIKICSEAPAHGMCGGF
ncbi:hypothetical protein DUNSADRAFT_14354 [Dunaliella salina]|uniref:Encoded protein n=1 Tax=Dunaliella salina TaxID=3046 RepID=A0ABQ7G7K1_DUNSA|nr:hypothetical protein DUNSADRAFT_14354 [Dunaliella salina]|eukprot:KAF5830569.1 hypothetical protein DUNSADRAFT_14354 [Dunaliella salina]